MAVTARSVDDGTGIDVLVDNGATGDMQIVKLAIATAGSETLIPADGTDGLKVNAASVVTALGTIDGHVDGLETLVTSTNTKLDTVNTNLGTLDGHVDGLETLVTSTNTKLDTVNTNLGTVNTNLGTIDGRVDGLEGLVTSTNTKLDTVNTNLGAIDGHVDGLEGLVTAPSNSTTTVLDNDGPVVAATAAVLYGFQGYCDAAGFVQVHNKATAPASTNVPVIVIPVLANAAFSLDLGIRGRAFSTGIAFGFSSVGPTYTDGGAHLWVDAQYI